MRSDKNASAKQSKRKKEGRKSHHGILYAILILILIGMIAGMTLLIIDNQKTKKTDRLAEAEANRNAQAEQQAVEAAEAEQQEAARLAEYQAAQAAAASAAEATATANTDTDFSGTPIPDSITKAQESSSAEEVIPTVKSSSKQITISFAGDCNLTSNIASHYDQDGAGYFFQNISKFFLYDDLTVVNLESPLTSSSGYADILTDGGIDCVDLANDHAYDNGDDGYTETTKTLDSADIDWFGDDDICVVNVKGTKVGFSGINACSAPLSCEEQAVENIEKLQDAGAEVIICEFHWGSKGKYTPTSAVQELAHFVIDAGADLVIGHNPQVLQGIELYNGKYICYSLGSICEGGSISGSVGSDYYTMIFQVTFQFVEDELQDEPAVTIIPCTIGSASGTNDYCPTPATGSKAESIMSLFYNTICNYIHSDYTISSSTPNQTIITDGGADYVGTGAADTAETEAEEQADAADQATAENGTEDTTENTGPDAEALELPVQ